MRGRRAGRIRTQPTQFIVSMQVTPTVLEGAAAEVKTFTIPVTRTGNPGFTGSVDWAVAPTGASPATISDFGGSFPSGTLNIDSDQLSAAIDIQIYGNDVPGVDRTFSITLSNAQTNGGSGIAMIAVPTAICTIIDEDTSEPSGTTYNGDAALYESDSTTYGTG